jgi:hypothetical protein
MINNKHIKEQRVGEDEGRVKLRLLNYFFKGEVRFHDNIKNLDKKENSQNDEKYI